MILLHHTKGRQAYYPGQLLTRFCQVPFRETHHISGRAVALAEQQGTTLSELTYEQFASLSDKFGKDVHAVFDFENSVEKRNAVGGPSRRGIATQVEFIRATLASLA